MLVSFFQNDIVKPNKTKSKNSRSDSLSSSDGPVLKKAKMQSEKVKVYTWGAKVLGRWRRKFSITNLPRKKASGFLSIRDLKSNRFGGTTIFNIRHFFVFLPESKIKLI